MSTNLNKYGWMIPNQMDEPLVKRRCIDCGQRLLDKCFNCNQFIKHKPIDEDDQCDSCGQELPEKVVEDVEVFEEQKDGTFRKICSTCRRKCDTCPECEQVYDSEQDASDLEDDSAEDVSNENSEEVTDEKTDDDVTDEKTDEDGTDESVQSAETESVTSEN